MARLPVVNGDEDNWGSVLVEFLQVEHDTDGTLKRLKRFSYDVVVYIDGSSVIARDYKGDLIASGTAGTDDASVAQSALNNLTNGRTWKEKVILCGNFSFGSSVAVPDYTILIIDGLIKQSSDDISLISLTESENVEIIGGILDGDKATNTSGIGIELDGVKNVTIKRILFKDFQDQAVYIKGTNQRFSNIIIGSSVFLDIDKQAILTQSSSGDYLTVNKCYFKDCDSDGETAVIHPYNDVNYSVITNNIILNSGRAAIQVSHGTDLAVGTIIAGNIIKNESFSSFGIQVYYAYETCIMGNIIEMCDYGIHIQKGDITTVTGNNIKDINYHALCLVRSQGCQIGNNNFIRFSVDGDNLYDGVHIDNEGTTPYCQFNTISDNYFDGWSASGVFAKYAINEVDSNNDYNVIIGNNIKNVHTGINKLGSNTIVNSNRGYMTENKGSATIANGNTSVTVNHGLVSTPTNIQVTGTHSEVKNAYAINPGSTSFDIKVDSAVSADRTVYWKAEV